jgi:hypothetical protein
MLNQIRDSLERATGTEKLPKICRDIMWYTALNDSAWSNGGWDNVDHKRLRSSYHNLADIANYAYLSGKRASGSPHG